MCATCLVYTKIINRVGEGIAATDDAGCSVEVACDLHRLIWIIIIKHAIKKLLEVSQLGFSVNPPLMESKSVRERGAERTERVRDG